MTNSLTRRRHWFRFSIANLFVLSLGITIGFVPWKLWELHEPPQPQLLVHLQVIDVPRESLQTLGIDRGNVPDSAVSVQNVANSFSTQIELLCRANKAIMLARPTLVTLNGRPASFLAGGEFPVPVLSEDGSPTVKYQEFGTRVDLLPTLLRNGRIRLAISPRITALDYSRSINIAGASIPAVRTRFLETEIEMDDGETVVFGGFTGESQQTMETLVVAKVERVNAR